MTTCSQLVFSDDRAEAIARVESISAGRGWCNVVPCVEDDVPDIKVNFTGLWVKHGVAEATFVTALPRNDVPQPSSMGFLHLRGRLGKERIAELLGGAPFTLRQDHSQRGLLFDVPPATPAAQVLDVMCSVSATLCDFEKTGSWRQDLYVRH
jgi:hypothetical protein